VTRSQSQKSSSSSLSAKGERAIGKGTRLPTGNLKIVHYPDPVLKKRCELVSSFDAELAELAAKMIELMHADNGVGLAAPQVGVSIRLFVCNPTGERGNNDLVIVNPVLSDLSVAEERDEGCLSLPGVTVSMRRSVRARLKAQTLTGERIELSAEGMPARIWQHEIDHLDGKLIIDHMSAADEIANRRAIKQMKADFKKSRR
jgi:peptide deformylase